MTADLARPTAGHRSLSAHVDWPAGRIRARGHLTVPGADLLSGAADALRAAGHDHIVLDLRQVRSADAAGLACLDVLRRRFAASGAELVVEPPPPAAT